MGGSSGGGGGDSQPRGVTIRGGRMRASTPTSSLDRTTDMQREAKATTAGKEFGVMSEQQRRDLAISQLKDRLENPAIPAISFLGVSSRAIQEANLRKQISALEAGAAPEFMRSTESGKYVAVGATTAKGTLGRQGEISGMTARPQTTMMQPDNGDRTPEVTPEVTPEIVPDDAQAAMLSGEAIKTRRTRGKRFAGAGSGEGEGILVRRT